jgi:hypothetical protein
MTDEQRIDAIALKGVGVRTEIIAADDIREGGEECGVHVKSNYPLETADKHASV